MAGDQGLGVAGRQGRGVRLNDISGLSAGQSPGRDLSLVPADVSRGVEHLPLQVGQGDGVGVDDRDPATPAAR